MQLDHALLVATREYGENVRTRGFWFGALGLPFLFLVFTFVPLALAGTESHAGYAVIDHSGWIYEEARREIVNRDVRAFFDALSAEGAKIPEDALLDELRTAIATPDDRALLEAQAAELIHTLAIEHASVRAPDLLFERFAAWWTGSPEEVARIAPAVSFARFEEVVPPSADRTQLDAMVQSNALLGYFVVPDDPVASAVGAQYVTQNLTNRDLQIWYGDVVSDLVQRQRIREENIAEDTAAWIQDPVDFEAVVLSDSGEQAPASLTDTLSQWAPVGFVYLLWISIFSITQMLLTNTIEEKSNKLVEVLLSSISAVELMAGKILGIAATGLTIVGVWLSALVLLIVWLPQMLGAPAALDLSGLVDNPLYLPSFILYFLLGYFFYAAVLCALGSVCNNLKEAQNMAMPVQFLLFLPLVVMIPIGRDPNGLVASILSWVPPLTPFVMLNRSASPPSIETYVFTTLLMVASIWFVLRLAARIFETGILMTGKPPRLRQIAALVRARGEPPA